MAITIIAWWRGAVHHRALTLLRSQKAVFAEEYFGREDVGTGRSACSATHLSARRSAALHLMTALFFVTSLAFLSRGRI